jgi:hypothetical protein
MTKMMMKQCVHAYYECASAYLDYRALGTITGGWISA